MLVFVDESGDAGFKLQTGSSDFFVMALVIFDDNLEAEKTSLAIKELRRKLKLKDKFEFKFNKTNKKFRKTFFNGVKSFKFKVRAIVVKKELIHSQGLRNNKEKFYNYVSMQLLKQSLKSIRNANLKFDKRGERALRDQLRVYLSNRLDNKHNQIFTDLKFVDSRQNTLIQLADMVSGAIFSDFTKKDSEYLGMLKRFRRIEDIWLFK